MRWTTSRSADRDHRRAVAEQALVRGDARLRVRDLAVACLAAQLPRELAHLRDRLRGPRLAEAAGPARRVAGDPAAQRRGAAAQEALRLAGLAQADVLVPVELERGREIVDLREREVFRSEAGLLVGRVGDRVLEAAIGSSDT